jgi:hypothetical protein
MSIHQSSFIAKAFTLISPVADWLSTWRLQILFLFLLLQVVSFCTQGIWVEDFWEHSAAVTAFIENPFHPGHPQFALQAPHPFLNPYTFVVAQFARLFHLDAISALSIFGTLNFCLFCFGLHAFIASLQLNNTNGTNTTSSTSGTAPSTTPSTTSSTTSCITLNNNKLTFYALLFILFLWGGKPWPYSGFFNYQIYLLNLPYPSTFVGGLSLLGLAINARYQHTQRWAYLLALIAITTLALLTHPLTAQFLLIGLAAQIFALRTTANNPQYSAHILYIKSLFLPFLKLAIISLVSFALATLWPFYPILELFQGASKAYDTSNGDMYFHLVTRLWLFVILAPVFIWMLFKLQLRPLLIIFIATASIYVFGYFTGRYSFGRIVSYTVIVIQIACAVAAFRFETWAQKVAPGTTRVGQLVIALVLISCTSPWLSGSAKRLLTVSNSVWLGRTVSNQVTYKDYLFLPSKLKVGSIVFANLESSWLIPSFGARVIAVNHPVAFVNDLEARQQDIGTFFDPKTSLHVRTELLKKYGAQYLLLNKKLDTDWVKIDQQFSNVENESQRVETETFLLIKLSS